MKQLILVRHAHADSNAGDVVNAVPPGGGLSELGVDEARALGAELAGEAIGIGLSSRLRRTQETLALALGGRTVPVVVEPLLDEIGFGSFEGGPLSAYRAWAWEHEPGADCPGEGESRVAAALRFAAALEAIRDLPAETVLAVSHALPLRYVLDAADGRYPAARVAPVLHATPYRLHRQQVETAALTLRTWAAAPRFVDGTADTPFGG